MDVFGDLVCNVLHNAVQKRGAKPQVVVFLLRNAFFFVHLEITSTPF